MTTSTRTSTKMRTRTGSSRTLSGFVLALALLLPAGVAAAKKKQPEPVAVIAGTVFRDPGFALPSAEVTVTPESGKAKQMKVVTNVRGEWAVRVPPVPMKYKVDVKSTGFAPQDKTVEIEGEQRKEVNFVLTPARQED